MALLLMLVPLSVFWKEEMNLREMRLVAENATGSKLIHWNPKDALALLNELETFRTNYAAMVRSGIEVGIASAKDEFVKHKDRIEANQTCLENSRINAESSLLEREKVLAEALRQLEQMEPVIVAAVACLRYHEGEGNPEDFKALIDGLHKATKEYERKPE